MDQWSKNHISLGRDSDNLQYGELRSYRGSRFVKFVLWIFIILKDTFETGESFFFIFSSSPSSPTVGEIPVREREDAPDSDISPVPVSELVDDRSGKAEETQANKIPKTNKKKPRLNGETRCVVKSRSGCKNLERIWWMKFLNTDSHASSSHEVSLEPTSKKSEDLRKHSVETHFREDRNCEICQRTKIPRSPCRRRNGGAVPRAENFGDLITADHKVLSV